jgi:glucokinase
MSQYVAGVDVGGTKIAAILMDAAGQTGGWITWPTEAAGGPNGVIERIVALIKFIME